MARSECWRCVASPYAPSAHAAPRFSVGGLIAPARAHDSITAPATDARTALAAKVDSAVRAFTSARAGGAAYTSLGLRLRGVTPGYNDNARARGVVAHGAPYVTLSRAGRSEGCPALEEQRARRVLPELSNGGMVYLFSPNSDLVVGAE